MHIWKKRTKLEAVLSSWQIFENLFWQITYMEKVVKCPQAGLFWLKNVHTFHKKCPQFLAREKKSSLSITIIATLHICEYFWRKYPYTTFMRKFYTQKMSTKIEYFRTSGCLHRLQLFPCIFGPGPMAGKLR